MSVISVIIPIYNTEEYLKRCVASILSQTFSDFELILVDNDSTDNCLSICKEYARLDDRIVVILEKEKGVGNARNVGLDYALKSDSKWIMFVDSDDWIDPRCMELLYSMAVLEKTKVQVCDYIRATEQNDTDRFAVGDVRLITPERLYCEKHILSIVSWAKLYAKELWKGIRFPEGIVGEDEFTIYKVMFQCQKISYLSVPMYCYFNNPNSIMRTQWSPARLSGTQGIKAQIDYFEQNGYQEARAYAIKIYAHVISNYISEAEQDNNNRITVLSMRKSLRKHIKKHRQVFSFSDKKNIVFYEKAYPLRMRFYWKLKSLKSRLKRVLF